MLRHCSFVKLSHAIYFTSIKTSCQLGFQTRTSFLATKSSKSIKDLKGELVYRSPNRRIVFGAKAFSLFSSATVLVFQPVLISSISNSGACLVAVFGGLSFSLITPCLLHILTRSHVTELYYNNANKIFTAYLKGLFLNTKTVRFKADDVSYAEPGLSLANISVNGIPLFVSETDFLNADVYKHLVGFDKPLSLKR